MSLARRLETYMPSDQDNRSARDLRASEIKQAWDKGYEAGVIAGAEAAAEDFAARQDQLSARLVEAVADLHTERAEAQSQLFAQLAPFLSELVETLAPALARAGLVSRVDTRLSEALATRPAAMPEIRCAPETVAALAPLAADHPASFQVREDPTLTPLEAQVVWDDGLDHLTSLPLIEDLIATIAEHSPQTSPTEKDIADVG